MLALPECSVSDPMRGGASKRKLRANSEPLVLPASGGISSLPRVVVDITSKRYTSPVNKSMHGLPASGGMSSLRLPASGGMSSLPHAVALVDSKPLGSSSRADNPGHHAFAVSRLSWPSGDTVQQRLPIVNVVTKPRALGDHKPILPLPVGKPNDILPASGGAPSLPVVTDTPQSFAGLSKDKQSTQALPACQATPSSRERHSGSALRQSPTGIKSSAGSPASGGTAVLPEVRCLGRVEGQSKRRYEAAVSAAEIPKLGPRRRRLQKKTIPCWRVNASDDLAMVADLFGGDLRDVTMPASGGSVPSTWFNYDACVEVLHEHGINPARIDALEVYAGIANWTEACGILGLKVGIPIDNKQNKNRWNLLSAKWRRVLWAIVVVCRPRWIHSGFPCTFWVRLAHLTRKKSLQQNEAERLRELVHVVLTLQLARWQHRHGFMMSLENPPDAQSWKLDIMLQTIRDTQMRKVYFDSCAWGHVDLGSHKPYLKRQCIAAFAAVDLSPLARRCSCPNGRKAGVHERIEGVTMVLGTGKVRKSVKSGEYPMMLCHAWGRIVKEHLRSP